MCPRQSYMSTDSTPKATSKRNTRASSAHPRGSKASAEPASSEKTGENQGDPLQAPVKPAEDAPELPKPSQIPWQTKVANSVNLIGYLGAPMQLGVSPDGAYTAVSILIHKKTNDLPQFWIPIVFRGDLAQIAACNLREKDYVYVTGQLTGQPEPADNDAESKIQVMVNSISYVLELRPEKKRDSSSEAPDSSLAEAKEDPSVAQLWNDLFDNPHKWWDNRPKDNKKTGRFKHKESGQSLEINQSTPAWVLQKLDSLVFSQTGRKQSGDSLATIYWTDLVENPQQWRDNREGKRSGKSHGLTDSTQLKPKFPDFSHKGTKHGLWLNSAPDWVLPKLEAAEASPRGHGQIEGKKVRTAPAKKGAESEETWKDLVENPKKWWDNRSTKLKPNMPDFKHKETGVALWLGSSTPTWVRAKLPSPMS
ncbi:unnamed protein product [Spirodela intermedia]|uniref:Uncharacterized protein n=1 Tax=Spirodela intermedia TaxID=51605 RepID=A0A7I8KMN2_SPIIN|nr:unnamed protein product [Spirodela intermedia]